MTEVIMCKISGLTVTFYLFRMFTDLELVERSRFARHLRLVSLPEFRSQLRMRFDTNANGGTCYCSMAFVIEGHF